MPAPNMPLAKTDAQTRDTRTDIDHSTPVLERNSFKLKPLRR